MEEKIIALTIEMQIMRLEIEILRMSVKGMFERAENMRVIRDGLIKLEGKHNGSSTIQN